ncbi:hypothetical protein [Halobacterium salinarum]|uniref:hypothetical protein n=1 Tax=Halobacterium salinarum TaxID=2242 RepID=UPI0025527EF5|nr:hypothetical protein [Halobacterium salinarum]MDL0133454.1 hypothetical protein [Halobacterium salinarum]
MRWPLAPGGSARGAGWLAVSGALSLAPKGAREGASESAQTSLSVGVDEKPAML